MHHKMVHSNPRMQNLEFFNLKRVVPQLMQPFGARKSVIADRENP